MLKTYQETFIKALVDDTKNISHLGNAHFSTEDVLNVYRNNYFFSITEALGATYSCVKRLVGDEFFTYTCHEFITKHPPSSGNIIEYGEHFADFLKEFPPAKELEYLSDIANFEYCYERVYHNPQASYLIFSPYNIIGIWQCDEKSDNIPIMKDVYVKIQHFQNEVKVFELETEEYLNRN